MDDAITLSRKLAGRQGAYAVMHGEKLIGEVFPACGDAKRYGWAASFMADCGLLFALYAGRDKVPTRRQMVDILVRKTGY